jgi:sensor histidine kinase regulating citrate/malate metabolism
MTPTQSFILTLASKVLYLIGIMVISRLFCNKRKKAQHTSIGLITIPVCNVIIILLMINVNVTSNLLSLACFILIVMNIVVFVINQKMITAETELEEQRLKQKFDYEEYTLLKETQQRAYILNHDLKEHMNALSSLIGSDNEKAQGYIKSIYGKINQSQFVEYSDSKILNILLSKKKEECRSKGIKFFIDPIQAKLTFFEDMDIVTVFSNLINNAIENCIMSEEKKMYLNIHTENENFVVIKTENTADVKTVVINGRLKTHKDNKKLHGIGMNSIKKTLSDYNGLLTWKYNEAERIFSKTIIIKLNRLGKYTTA